MKKMAGFIFGLIIGVVIMIPLGVHAWSYQQQAKPIYGADCSGPYKYDSSGNYVLDKNGQNVNDPSGTDGRCSVVVYVFDDAGNKCYITKGSNASGISCIKER